MPSEEVDAGKVHAVVDEDELQAVDHRAGAGLLGRVGEVGEDVGELGEEGALDGALLEDPLEARAQQQADGLLLLQLAHERQHVAEEARHVEEARHGHRVQPPGVAQHRREGAQRRGAQEVRAVAQVLDERLQHHPHPRREEVIRDNRG